MKLSARTIKTAKTNYGTVELRKVNHKRLWLVVAENEEDTSFGAFTEVHDSLDTAMESFEDTIADYC